MLKHLQKDIEILKNKVITMGGEVEDRVVKATLSIIRRDEKLANSVIEAAGILTGWRLTSKSIA